MGDLDRVDEFEEIWHKIPVVRLLFSMISDGVCECSTPVLQLDQNTNLARGRNKPSIGPRDNTDAIAFVVKTIFYVNRGIYIAERNSELVDIRINDVDSFENRIG